MTPERLKQLAHHHERMAHFTVSMMSELFEHIATLEALTAYVDHTAFCACRTETLAPCDCGLAALNPTQRNQEDP